MAINAKCNDCEEPTKYVVGFFDGKNGIHGCLYDCHNEECKSIVQTNKRRFLHKIELERGFILSLVVYYEKYSSM